MTAVGAGAWPNGRRDAPEATPTEGVRSPVVAPCCKSDRSGVPSKAGDICGRPVTRRRLVGCRNTPQWHVALRTRLSAPPTGSSRKTLATSRNGSTRLRAKVVTKMLSPRERVPLVHLLTTFTLRRGAVPAVGCDECAPILGSCRRDGQRCMGIWRVSYTGTPPAES